MKVNPEVDRPEMPEGYGADTADSFVEWSEVETRLLEARHYWLATTRPDGRPHVVPRWGVWIEGAFWYDGSPQTRHVRNLELNPNCVLHLEDGEKAVMLEGRSVASEPVIGEMGERLASEFSRKYAPVYEPEADAWAGDDAGGIRLLQPLQAIAWTRFPSDITRFKFTL